MKKKLNESSYKKLIKEYQEKLNKNQKENDTLKMQVEDMKMTLTLNKDLVKNYLQQIILLNNEDSQLFLENKNSIDVLNKENLTINEKFDDLFTEKRINEKRLFLIQEEIESRLKRENDNLKNLNDETVMLNNKIQEKDLVKEHLNNEIEKLINHKEIEFAKDLFVINPTKVHLELNTELFYTKELINKLSKVVIEDKSQNEKYECEIKNLEKELEDLRTNLGIVKEKEDKQVEVISISISQSSEDEEIDFNNSSDLDDSNEEEFETNLNNLFLNNFTQEDSMTGKNLDKNNSAIKTTQSIISNYKNMKSLDLKKMKTNKLINTKTSLDDLYLDSPQVIFPDKVIMKNSVDVNLENNITHLLPKLDLEILNSKYVPINKNIFPGAIEVKIKKSNTFNSFSVNQIKSNTNIDNQSLFTKLNKNSKFKTEKETLIRIEKIRQEIKTSNEDIIELKGKLEKYKIRFREDKIKMNKLKENIKLANSKIEILEKQINDYINENNINDNNIENESNYSDLSSYKDSDHSGTSDEIKG